MYNAATDKAPNAAPSSFGDINSLTAALSHLSDAEIESLEDDLNFFAFTGITSARIEAVMTNAGMVPAPVVANCNVKTRLSLAS